MGYFVKMKETDGVTVFSACFTAQDELDIQAAQPDVPIVLSEFKALLGAEGEIDIMTMKPTIAHHWLKYATLCQKLAQKDEC